MVELLDAGVSVHGRAVQERREAGVLGGWCGVHFENEFFSEANIAICLLHALILWTQSWNVYCLALIYEGMLFRVIQENNTAHNLRAILEKLALRVMNFPNILNCLGFFFEWILCSEEEIFSSGKSCEHFKKIGFFIENAQVSGFFFFQKNVNDLKYRF